jgi:hypothetical protein
LLADLVQQPRLVRRGDTVQLRSVAAGISITVEAKSYDEGALDDVVTVVPLDDRNGQPIERRERISARVTGRRQVEVFAASPQYKK